MSQQAFGKRNGLLYGLLGLPLAFVALPLYVILPTNKLDESSKLLNIFFSSLIGNNLSKQLGEEPDLKYQMLLMMDEFTAMEKDIDNYIENEVIKFAEESPEPNVAELEKYVLA